MEVLIDYLTFSSKIHSVSYFIERLGLVGCNFIDMPGRYSYFRRKYYQGVNIYFEAHNLDMGICVELSGAGCRLVEELSGYNFDWCAFLSELYADMMSRDVHISRLDIAADDKSGVLQHDELVRCCRDGLYICKSRRRIWIGGDQEEVLFGSPASDRRLRIYNKALEQCFRRRLVDDDVHVYGHWWRVELQLRDDCAQSFLLNLVSSGWDIGTTYAAVLYDYIRFISEPVRSNRYDLVEVLPWWEMFVGALRRTPQLYLCTREYTIHSVRYFLEHQTASSLKLWLLANNGDFSDLQAMIDKAVLNKRQKQLLDQIRLETGIL